MCHMILRLTDWLVKFSISKSSCRISRGPWPSLQGRGRKQSSRQRAGSSSGALKSLVGPPALLGSLPAGAFRAPRGAPAWTLESPASGSRPFCQPGFLHQEFPCPFWALSCKEGGRGATSAYQGGRGVPWAQATSTVAVECFAPVSSSEVTCHWPLRDLVPRRVTPFLAFTLGQSGKKKREMVSLRPRGCPPGHPPLCPGWGWE